ncbi:hypothetical protein [Pleurocapsa sp. PCC 7319]|uniref:hypothetical protein n=1 Tax=Pleurocapsa sp. PCC 7319 TaxID=118161 RepID=UPI000344F88D|nr:hypothetical protein [Pleurocapsa sp. PCC 7319]
MSELDSLNSKLKSDLHCFPSILTQPLGLILQQADLVSSFQIESALQDQIRHPDLRIGEILSQKGFIKTETADFFVQDWSKALIQPDKNALGYYLKQAGIINSAEVEVILAVQRDTGVRFGTVAVFQGFLKSTTLDFFLANLYPDEVNISPFVNMYSQRKSFPPIDNPPL